MNFADYQTSAQETDQVRGNDGDAIMVPLLGMAGEVGSLATEYKKHLRDRDSHHMFREHVSEELGDILWYLANVATKFSLSLDDIAGKNLNKTRSRWRSTGVPAFVMPLDDHFPPDQQLPRKFRAILFPDDTESTRIKLFIDGESVGDALRDNAYSSDGYRFHDVFHLGHATILGWSPVVRSLMKRKRKSHPAIDEVEDGGRAIVLDEAAVAMEWNYARDHNFLEGVETIDYGLLNTLRSMTAGLEVRVRSCAEWELAILRSFAVWREVKKHNGGIIQADLLGRSFEFVGPVSEA
jgi:NTP pyrophosphatase (non-canonical NTP hydrolase)